MRHLLLLLLVACSASPNPGIGDAAAQCEPGVRYECDCGAGRLKGQALCSKAGTRGGCECQSDTDAAPEDDGGRPDANCSNPTTYYRDLDGDGFGSGVPTPACVQPDHYVTKDGDCDDTDARAFPGQTMFFTTPRKTAPLNESFDFNCDHFTTKCCTEADSCESQGCR